MIPGKRITLADGQPYIVPSFTFRQRRELDEDAGTRDGLASADPRERCAAAFIVAHRSLVRNYPALKPEDMEGLLDPGLVMPLLEAILGKVEMGERVTGEPSGQ